MPPEDPLSAAEPQTAQDYFRQGWMYHTSDGNEIAAEESFRQAIDLNKNYVDAYYGLGLVLKLLNRDQESVEAFQTVINKIEAGAIEDHARAEMLRRLSLGHINQLISGDWGLEEEIWQHK